MQEEFVAISLRHAWLTGFHEWFTVVPDGGWKSIEGQGKTCKVGLRKLVVIAFHDAPIGGHQDRDRTRDAITDAGLVWENLKMDIDGHIRHCQVCRWSRLLYMFTCVCPYGGWSWAIPCAADDSITAAKLFAECVKHNTYLNDMFDIAGVPVILCSDRA